LPVECRVPHWGTGAEGCQTKVASIQMSSKLIQDNVQEAGRRRVPVRAASTPRSPGDDDRSGTAIITRTTPRAKRPSLYRVLLLNDDYTPQEFVVHILERFFNKNHDDAYRIMMHVHHNGVGECGVFTYEVAETKVTQVMDFARKHQHPLQCVMEKK
jgi:ATP-dependent Clp protease adaptor protein ClpS